MEFKTIEEYYKEFRNTGKESFYDFLEEKLQEAKNNNNQELEGYIYSLQNEVANNEFYDFQEAETKREEQENWVGNTYDEEIEDEPVEETTVEGSSTSAYVENEEKEALLEELSDLQYELSKLEDEMRDVDFHAKYESFEREHMSREYRSSKDRIEEIENQIYMIEMGELGTSLTSMTPDEIKKQYEELLRKRESYKQMAEDGHEVDDLEWKINSGLIEMIEEYIKANPELSEFEQPSNDEVEALLAKEMKSKSARDAGFEINEFGEIIRPTKPMDEMSVEELAKTEAEYDKIITDNDEKIKQAYIERLLKKQQTIESQRAVLKELEGQGIDIDD